MKNYSKKSGFVNFLSGKGFYIALAICLAGAGFASWFAVQNTITGISSSNQDIVNSIAAQTPAPVSTTASWDYPLAEEVRASTEGIPVSSDSPSTQPVPVYSPPAQSEPSAQSEQPVVLPTPQVLAYVLPIESSVFANFSGDELIKNVTLGDWRTHNGIDIAAEIGTEVICVADGQVLRVYEDALWGNVVEIQHEQDIVSRYCGLASDIPVQEGDKVKIQDVIGALDIIPGESALQTHLHFEMKVDGKYVDPLVQMNKVKPTEE